MTLRLRIGVWGVLLAAVLEGCAMVLGLDPPTLAPCPDGCSDAEPSIDAALDSETETPASDSSNDQRDASADREAGPAPSGVLCGLGSSGGAALHCAQPGPTPYCCETSDDAGQPTFACVTNQGACQGYPIQCAKDGDCPGTDICCHHTSGMTCEQPAAASGTCSSGIQACDPLDSDPNECPKGTTCKLSLTNSQLESPYLGCQ